MVEFPIKNKYLQSTIAFVLIILFTCLIMYLVVVFLRHEMNSKDSFLVARPLATSI